MRKKGLFKRLTAVTLSLALTLPVGGITPAAELPPAQAAEATTKAATVTLPTPIYHFDFDDVAASDGTTTISSSGGQKEGTATIVGNGVVEEDMVDNANRGKVFHNDPANTGALRTNYLKLPADSLSYSAETKELTIGFWVNTKGENRYWSPLFSAYGAEPVANGDGVLENTWPVMGLLHRGTALVNCAGITNFLDADNVNGTNVESTEWANNSDWHFYTATFTENLVTVYNDGVIANQWTCDGSADHNVSGLFSNGSDLKVICLGGNQAWAWADADTNFYYDDVVIYNKALDADQIASIIADKKGQATEVTVTPETAEATNVKSVIGGVTHVTCGEVQLSAYAKNALGNKIKWSIAAADASKATVTQDGLVTLSETVKDGDTIQVIASASDRSGVTGTCTVTAKVEEGEEVSAIAPKSGMESVNLSRNYTWNGAKMNGGSITLSEDDFVYTTTSGLKPDDKDFTLSTDADGAKIINIDGKTITIGKGKGTAKVTVTSVSGSKPVCTIDVVVDKAFGEVTDSGELDISSYEKSYSGMESVPAGDFDVTYTLKNKSLQFTNDSGNLEWVNWASAALRLYSRTKICRTLRPDIYDEVNNATVTWSSVDNTSDVNINWEAFRGIIRDGIYIIRVKRTGNNYTVTYKIGKSDMNTNDTGNVEDYTITATFTDADLANDEIFLNITGNLAMVSETKLRDTPGTFDISATSNNRLEYAKASGSGNPFTGVALGDKVQFKVSEKADSGYVVKSVKYGDKTLTADSEGVYTIGFVYDETAKIVVEETEKKAANKTELNASIAEAEKLSNTSATLASGKKYTDATWSALETELKAAKAVAEDADAVQEDADDAKTKLDAVMKALVFRCEVSVSVTEKSLKKGDIWDVSKVAEVVTDGTDKNVTWAVKNPTGTDVITLSGTTVTASAAGEAKLTVTAADGTAKEITVTVEADEEAKPDEPEEDVILGDASVAGYKTLIEKSRVSVHDPSVVQDPDTGRYYIFGSHLGWAWSDDMKTWTTFTNNITLESAPTIFKDEIAWCTKGDEEYKVDGNMWAPDVIWNETMQKWCMYMSINGPKWNSTISLLTADKLDGDWTYVGPVIQSGMSNGFGVTFDYEKVTGSTDVKKYTDSLSKGGNPTIEAHAIDPCVIYDDDGNLWMTYGSWSGGISMIRLDNKTGLRDYSVTYKDTSGKTDSDGVISDDYTGYKIAGGNAVSGEGSYIQKVGKYYFLFMSYGGYAPTGGYNMRLFRSEKITGPYTDVAGRDARTAVNSKAGATDGTTGVRLMSYYKWNFQKLGHVAQGHNSAIVDPNTGKTYLVYHDKFNDGTVSHEVRVHQLFTNEDGWLVAAPFEYNDETVSASGYDESKIIGNYQVILQKAGVAEAKLEVCEEESIVLSKGTEVKDNDVVTGYTGDITGDYSGTWSMKKGSPYITLEIGNVTYKGVLCDGILEETNIKAMTFSAVGNDNVCLWGYKVDDSIASIQLALENAIQIPSQISSDIELPVTAGNGTTITWTSNNFVLSDAGKVLAVKEDTDVTLSATIKCGKYQYTKNYTVTVLGSESIKDDHEVVLAEYFKDTPHTIGAKSATFDNPFFNCGKDLSAGASISFDIKRTEASDRLANIISLMGSQGRLYFTGGSYLGYNGPGGYYDANMDNWTQQEDLLKTGEYVTIKMTFTSKGFKLYADDVLAYSYDSLVAGETPGGYLPEDGADLPATMFNWLQIAATKVYIGYGNWWSDVMNGEIKNIIFSYKEAGKDVTGGSGSSSNLSGIYTEDYESTTDMSTEWISTNAQDAVGIGQTASHGKFMLYQHPASTNSRGMYSNVLGNVSTWKDSYVLEFDMGFKAGNNQKSQFAVKNAGTDIASKTINNGTAAGYVFLLEATNSTTWTINGDATQTVTIPAADTEDGGWVHVKLTCDTKAGTVEAVITDGETELYKGTVNMDKGSADAFSNPTGFYTLAGRYTSIFKFDNLEVKDAGVEYASLASYTVALERAKQFVELEDVYEADGIQKLKDLIAKAEAEISASTLKSDQDKVDDYTTSLIAAVDALEYKSYEVTVTVEGKGTVTGLSEDGKYRAGTGTTLKATAAEGYKFVKWTDGDGKELGLADSLVITVTKNMSICAVFEKEKDDSDEGENPGGSDGSDDSSNPGDSDGSDDSNNPGGSDGSEDGNNPGGSDGSEDGNNPGGSDGSEDGNNPGGSDGSDDSNNPGDSDGSEDGNNPGGSDGSGDGNNPAPVPTKAPVVTETEAPTKEPEIAETEAPTKEPEAAETEAPTKEPEVTVTSVPTVEPTSPAVQTPSATTTVDVETGNSTTTTIEKTDENTTKVTETVTDKNGEVVKEKQETTVTTETEIKVSITVSNKEGQKLDVSITKSTDGTVKKTEAVVSTGTENVSNGKVTVSVGEEITKELKDNNLKEIQLRIEKPSVERFKKEDSNKKNTLEVKIGGSGEVQVSSVMLAKESALTLKKTGKQTVIKVETSKTGSYTVTLEKSQLKLIGSDTKDICLDVEQVKASKLDNGTLKTKVDKVLASNKVSKTDAYVVNLAKTSGMKAGVVISAKPAASKAKAGTKVYVYKYNAKTGKLVETANSQQTVAKDGTVKIAAYSGVKYVVSKKKLTKGKVTSLLSKTKVTTEKKTVEKNKKTKISVKLATEFERVSKFGKSTSFAKEGVKVTYQSLNKKVAKVDKNGNVTGKKKGKVKVRAIIKQANGNIKKKTFTFKVK